MYKTSHPGAVRLEELHEMLHRQIAELQEWIHEADEFGRPQFGQLGDRIKVLRQQMAGHFALEEAGGYMREPLEAAPHLSERVAALLRDHARLLLELDELSERLRQVPVPYQFWGDACSDLQNVLDLLERHEHEERSLWQEAFGKDAGSAD